jgi:hypothetical protein
MNTKLWEKHCRSETECRPKTELENEENYVTNFSTIFYSSPRILRAPKSRTRLTCHTSTNGKNRNNIKTHETSDHLEDLDVDGG